jgi:hypothetical protein
MQLTTRLPERSASKRPARKPAAPPEPVPEPQETRAARRGGGPQDEALYSCSCGFVFRAPVTTAISCPHCATEQAW